MRGLRRGLLNLETSITSDGEFAPGKAVHYRMHPDNLACLSAIRPDLCVLANNHVLDFGRQGLTDTLDALAGAGIRGVGAGMDSEEAQRPAVLPLAGGGRVVAVSAGMESSGIPPCWAATAGRPGVALVPDLSDRSAAELSDMALAVKRPGDVVIVSLHWGSNWGYHIESGQTRFAHRLIDADIDLVHGHSSHHPRPIEVYRGKLILYGCGDLINDHEGIRGFDAYRGQLRLLYFASVDPGSGTLTILHMVPMQAKNLRLHHVAREDAEWLRSTLDRTSRHFGTRVGGADGTTYLTVGTR